MWAGLVFAASAGPAPKPKVSGTPVLVLVSRNVSDPWAAAEVDGIRHAFAAAQSPITPAVEYLDWQSGSSAEYEEKLASYYATKFAKRNIRVIIAAENAAVDFLLRHRDALFPEAQAVFCGIPRFEEKRRQPWCTGVLEISDPAGTFQLALRLQPRLKHFIILDDASGAGMTARRMIENGSPDAPDRVEFEVRRADTVQDTYGAVENLPPNSAVLLTKSRLVWKVMEELRDHCAVPIYGTRAPTQLPGILGGSLLDGDRQGQAAARIALRLLAGEHPADIPFDASEPHRVVVDYGQLQRFGIPLSLLPPGCEVLNRPLTLWERHGHVVLVASGIIGALGLVVLGLLWLLQQKRAAAAQLDHSLSVLNATFDSIADGVVVVGNAGQVVGHNERFLTLWSIPREVAEKKQCDALLQFVLDQLKDPEAFARRVEELYANPEATSAELIEFKDGRVFESDSRPQRQGGKIVGRVWSFRDVTARRRAEEEHERLAAQLSQAQKMEALGTLAGGIAHDFNNMLTGILGCSDMALSRLPATHPASEELRQVIASAERASDLVRQILTFSRKRTPEKKVVFLEPIVRDTLKLLRATTPAAIELAAELQPGVPPVFADPVQMNQALLNLCTNGIHAMGRGPGELRIVLACREPATELRQAHPHLPASPLVCLSVSDTGHGMDATTLAHIFEPFYTTKGPGEGTGLGLAVVHGIVQAHEGAVGAQSELKHGTTFTLFLPPAVVSEAEPIAQQAAPRGQGECILVVDDEATVAEVAASMLRKLGYEPTTCASAERALELLGAEPGACALVLSDLNMPRLTGLDLIRRLREADNRVPFVLVTGFIGSAANEQEAHSLGVREILQKPFTPDSLGWAVSRALADGRPAPTHTASLSRTP